MIRASPWNKGNPCDKGYNVIRVNPWEKGYHSDKGEPME